MWITALNFDLKKGRYSVCNNRYYDVISVAASFLTGIVFAVLAFADLLVTGITVPILALVLGLFALGVTAWSNAHGLRCLDGAARLILSALALIAVAVFALVFVGGVPAVALIITFLIFSLMAYTLFSLFCFLTCREKRQREMSTVNCR